MAALITFSGFTQQSGEWYQGKPIKDIVFTGLKHINASELDGIVEPFIGSLFTDDIFWEIQGRLYALEYFELISPSAVPADSMGNEVIIRFTVTEKPVVLRVDFVGNTNIRRAELLDVVSVKVNDVVNQVKLRVDELAITNKYLEKGFPDVKVRSETGSSGEDASIVVTFFIDEGEQITIEAFHFEGNAVFSANTLQRQLSLKAKGLFNDGAFQEAKLIADRNAITQYYHERGYIEAAVNDVVRELRKDDKGGNVMIITFVVHEGRIYNFGGITFEGNKIFSAEQLGAQILSKTGETVNSRRVEADYERVTNLYYENGYIFNTIVREETRNSETGVVSFKISIIERDRAHIENIIIRGNKKTKDAVILREIPLEEGDVFSRSKIMDALRNLYNLQYFSNIVPDTPPGSADNLMDLVINVEEQPTTDIQFGLTFSGSSDPDVFPISGMIRWNDRNFMGYGNTVGAELDASINTFNLALEYTHRWIFGLPLDAGFDFTASYTRRRAAMGNSGRFNGDETYAFPDGFESYDEYEDAQKLPPNEYLMSYDQWRFSIGISSGYRFSTVLGSLLLRGGIRTGMILSSYDEEMFRPFDPILRAENGIPTPANSVWISLSLDRRDIYYDPSSGYYGSQRFGYYGVFEGEREHYIKSDTKAEWFITLLNAPITETFSLKAVFGIHSGLSFIFRQPFRDTIPIETANMLAVDGMFIGRGWSGEYRNKGLALWENWAEIRVPLVPGILAWDFFFDAAGIDDDFETFFSHFSIENMRFSFGGGFRFSIPQFPFRFSFAKRFKVADGAVQWQQGALFKDEGDTNSGIDFVISFALSTY
jgi:outer membrane protein insertion porin family